MHTQHGFLVAFTTDAFHSPVLYHCFLLVAPCTSGRPQENRSSHPAYSGMQGLLQGTELPHCWESRRNEDQGHPSPQIPACHSEALCFSRISREAAVFLGKTREGRPHRYLSLQLCSRWFSGILWNLLQISHLSTVCNNLQRIMASSLPTCTSHRSASHWPSSKNHEERGSGKCSSCRL